MPVCGKKKWGWSHLPLLPISCNGTHTIQCSMHQYVRPLHCQLIFQCVDLPYFIHSSTDGLSLHVTSAPNIQSRVCWEKKKISPIIPLCLSSHDPLPLVHFWGLFSKNTAGSRRARPNPATPIRLLKSMLYFQSSHLPSHFQGTKVDHHICFLACGAHSGPESWADIFLLPVIRHLCSSVTKVSNTLKAREFPFCVAN